MEATSTLEDAGPCRAPVLPSWHPLGHLLRFRSDPLGMFEDAMAQGDLVRARAAHRHLVLAFHPDHVEHVLVRNAGNYIKRTRGYHKLRLILGRGLVTSDGDLWRRQRRIVNPAFHRECVESFAGVMVDAAREHVQRWRRLAGTGQPIDVAEELSSLTLQVVGQTLFGTEFDAATRRTVGEALGTALHHFNRMTSSPLPRPELWPTPGNHRFRQAVRRLEGVVQRIIADRAPEGGADLLTLLLSARDDDGEPMSADQLRDEVVTLLLAGHETTANALAWTLYLLSKHPEAAREVRAELDDVLGGRLPGVQDLRALEVTRRVLYESMRLYPPIWALGRTALEDDTIDGFRVPAGSFVYLGMWATHRHPGQWEDPERFDPDRFTDERSAGRHRYAFVPFSAGQRKCLGDRFAEMEALLVLATVLQEVQLDLVPGYVARPETGVTLRPGGGMPMTVDEVAPTPVG